MAFFSRHSRLLYLLALFQLVGGPLVLGGVIMFVRLASDKNVTLNQQVAQAIESVQRLEQGNLPEEVWAQTDGAPQPAKPSVPVPGKTKDGKIKLVGISEFFEGVVLTRDVMVVPLGCWCDAMPVMRAQAPPLPPPRMA